MILLLKWIGYALAVIFTAWIIPGINVDSFLSAMLVAVVLGLINALIKPVFMFIAIPLNVLTIGLFTFVINAFLLWLAGVITPGFSVSGFWSALLGSIVLSLITTLLNSLSKDKNEV